MRARLLGKRMVVTVLWLLGLLWVLALFVGVVASIVLDADMLVGAGGPWMVLIYLVVPACIAIPWLVRRVREYRDDRHYLRNGEELLRQHPPEQTSSGWRTLRAGDESAREGMAALSAAERSARGEPPVPF